MRPLATPALNNASNLIWLDMEMTGLSPNDDHILEIAIVITDKMLNMLAEAPTLVIHQPETILAQMDNWNQSTHQKSGLIERVKQSQLSEIQAEKILLDFVKEYVPINTSPMCGNSICQDRRFMAKYLPQLEAFFHYRNIDVSTIKELCRRWQPDLLKGFKKKQAHTALADVLESIEELKYYQQHFIRS